jgi:hypothetical protein
MKTTFVQKCAPLNGLRWEIVAYVPARLADINLK